MSREIQVEVRAEGTPHVLWIPRQVWENFLDRVVKRNMSMGKALEEALNDWQDPDRRWGEEE